MPNASNLSFRLPRKRQIEESAEGDDQYCEVIDVSFAKRQKTIPQEAPRIINFFKRIGEWFKRTSQSNTHIFGVSSESNSAEEAIAHGGQYLEEASNDKFMPTQGHNGNGNPALRPPFNPQYDGTRSKTNSISEQNPRPSLVQGVFVNGDGLLGEHPNSYSMRKDQSQPMSTTNYIDHGSQQSMFGRATSGLYDYTTSTHSDSRGGSKSVSKGHKQGSGASKYTMDASDPDSSECNEQINGTLQRSYVDRAVKHRVVKHHGTSSASSGLLPDSVYDKSFGNRSVLTSGIQRSNTGNISSINRECFNLNEKERYKRLLQKFSLNNKTISNLSQPFLNKQNTGTSSARSSTDLGITSSILALDKPLTTLFNASSESSASSGVSGYLTASQLNDISASTVSHRRRTEYAPKKTHSGKKAEPMAQPSEIAIKCDNLVKRMEQVRLRSLTRIAENKHLKAEEMKLEQWEKMRAEEDEHLERMVQQRLKLSAKVILKDLPAPEVEEYDEFPELSDEADLAVSKALQRGPNNILSEAFRLKISRKDIATLASQSWLNDEVVNFYFNLIQDRAGKDDFPPVYVFNTFFYPKIMKDGHKGVRRWTKQVDLFTKDMILVPIHLGMHWCLATINLRDKNIQYFDSMGGDNYPCLAALKRYIEDESMDKKQAVLNTSGWVLECVKDIPQQMNGSDCGVFSCKYAEYLSRDAPFTFSQGHMPYFRERMVYEILIKKLL